MKHPGGRPTKYRRFFCKDLIDYFNISPTRLTTITYTNKKGEQWTEEKTVANDFPTLSGFAAKIGVDDDTIQQWKKVYPEFSVCIKKAITKQQNIILVNAMANRYAQPMAIFFMKNVYHWKDKSEVDTKQSGTVTIKRISYDGNNATP